MNLENCLQKYRNNEKKTFIKIEGRHKWNWNSYVNCLSKTGWHFVWVIQAAGSVVAADGDAVGILRGGNMPNLAVGRMVPGAIFLNSNMEPKSTCWITGNLASNCNWDKILYVLINTQMKNRL